MSNDSDADRHRLIQAVHTAARLERAQTLRRLLQGLLHGRAAVCLGPAASQPALGESR